MLRTCLQRLPLCVNGLGAPKANTYFQPCSVTSACSTVTASWKTLHFPLEKHSSNVYGDVLVLSVVFHVLLWLGTIEEGSWVGSWDFSLCKKNWRNSGVICFLHRSSLLSTTAICYSLQAPAQAGYVLGSCLSRIKKPICGCRWQRGLIKEARSYKHLVTIMMKWDIGELCPLLAPTVGFLLSDSKWLLIPRSLEESLRILPFLAIQGVSVMSPSAEAWRVSAAGDSCMSSMASC